MIATVSQPSRRTQTRIDEFAHPALFAGELEQGNHGKGKLQAQHHLAQHQQGHHRLFAGSQIASSAGADGQHARRQAAHRGPHAELDEAFHHHLAGQGAGDGGALPRGQQAPRQRPRRPAPPSRLSADVGVLNWISADVFQVSGC